MEGRFLINIGRRLYDNQWRMDAASKIDAAQIRVKDYDLPAMDKMTGFGPILTAFCTKWYSENLVGTFGFSTVKGRGPIHARA
jgi:hypothetical protein